MFLNRAVLKNIYAPNIELYGKALELVTEKKTWVSLSVIVFNVDEHINIEISITYARIKTVIRHFKHCSADVKVTLYNWYCCSTYCCALISVYHKTVLEKLTVACNKVYKSLIGVPRDFSASALYDSLNVCNFVILQCKLAYSF